MKETNNSRYLLFRKVLKLTQGILKILTMATGGTTFLAKLNS